MNKRGQMKLSFGMIFSIILIVMFLAFGFYGINSLLKTQNSVQIEQFKEGLQNKIIEMQKSNYGSDEVSFLMPKKVEGICFVEAEKNVQIHEKDYFDEITIDGLNEEKTVGDDENLCIKVEAGKVKFKLSKEYGEPSITVSKLE